MKDNLKPRPKVAAGGIAGTVTVLLVFVAQQAGFDLPPEVASAITVLISFIAAYIKSE